MRLNFRAMENYGNGGAEIKAATANRVELIQMLFDGLIDNFNMAKGHIQHKNIVEKGRALQRASRILVSLKGALDFEKGGELAMNLNELYAYVIRRIIHINAQNDLEALAEVHSLMSEIREAWRELPSLIPANLLHTHH
jgi:flagellar protein FliS